MCKWHVINVRQKLAGKFFRGTEFVKHACFMICMYFIRQRQLNFLLYKQSENYFRSVGWQNNGNPPSP